MHNPLRSEADAFRMAMTVGAGAAAVIALSLLAGPEFGVVLAAALIGVGIGSAWRASRGSEPHKAEIARGDGRAHRILVVANETVGGGALLDEIRNRSKGRDTEILVVTPALVGSAVKAWASDVDDAIEAARRRQADSVRAIEALGLKARGLQGAPPVRVLVGEHAHATIFVALRMLGLGTDNAIPVGADDAGRMKPDRLAAELERGEGPVIVCAQAGEVNTGCFDPLDEVASACEAHGAWLHVDGAIGLWAAATPSLAHLTRGLERADSWSTDAHKWLNVPYDCGFVAAADQSALRGAMGLSAAYLTAATDARDSYEYVPESSRRARGFALYAALRSLGRRGVAELVERCCELARLMAAELDADPSLELLNDVAINQVLVAIPDDASGDATAEAIARIQEDGTCWLAGTTWRGRPAIRVSISNWRTSEDDVRRSAGVIRRCVEEATARR